MDHKEKVIAAITDLEARRKDIATQRQRLAAAEQAERHAEQHLVRVLRAVFGEADFEVLG